jgi:hypothetical protein
MRKKIKPYKERLYPVGSSGIQKLYKFPNGWGASVVRFKLDISTMLRPAEGGGTYGSYTRNENEWELAVIKWGKNDDYELDYDNKVADGDVVGYLTGDEVEKLLLKISKFKKVAPSK